MWSDLHNLPRFLPGVQEVKDLGEGRSMWTMTVDEKPMHWESVFVASKNAVTWKSQRGSIFANSGTVRFDPAPAGARIQVTLSVQAIARRTEPDSGTLVRARTIKISGGIARRNEADRGN